MNPDHRGPDVLSSTAISLRQAFDDAFVQPARADTVPQDDFLAIRVAGDAHALRLTDISSLLPLKAVTRLPSPLAGLLGVTGFRGAIVPMYDLGVLLGYPAGETARWMVVTAGATIGLAFGAFDGHLRCPRETSAQPTSTEPSRAHVREVLRSADALRPVVSVVSLVEAIQGLARQCLAQQEK